jgi:glucose-1-phosphate adenylyltransferase
VIVERGCSVPAGSVIGEDPVSDRTRFMVSTGGVALVTQESLSHMEQRAA